jgi:hypothetical protein
MEDRLTIKLLKKGDTVLNVWHSDSQINIAIKREEEVFVYRVEPDENGQPRLSNAPTITLTYGEGEVTKMEILFYQ